MLVLALHPPVWPAHGAWVNATPWAIALLHDVYMSITSAMMIVLGLLEVMRRFDRIRTVAD